MIESGLDDLMDLTTYSSMWSYLLLIRPTMLWDAMGQYLQILTIFWLILLTIAVCMRLTTFFGPVRRFIAPGTHFEGMETLRMEFVACEIPTPPPHCDSHHPLAAAQRNGAIGFFKTLACVAGRSLYSLDKSTRDQRDGIPGLKDAIAADDLKSTVVECNDAVPSSPLLCMSDTDFRLSKRELSRRIMHANKRSERGHPLVMWTYAPKAPGYVEDEVAVSYEGDGLWKTRVPNNTRDARFWHWEGETVAVNHETWWHPYVTLLFICSVMCLLSFCARPALNVQTSNLYEYQHRAFYEAPNAWMDPYWGLDATGCYNRSTENITYHTVSFSAADESKALNRSIHEAHRGSEPTDPIDVFYKDASGNMVPGFTMDSTFRYSSLVPNWARTLQGMWNHLWTTNDDMIAQGYEPKLDVASSTLYSYHKYNLIYSSHTAEGACVRGLTVDVLKWVLAWFVRSYAFTITLLPTFIVLHLLMGAALGHETIVYRIERRDVGDGRALILLEPYVRYSEFERLVLLLHNPISRWYQPGLSPFVVSTFGDYAVLRVNGNGASSGYAISYLGSTEHVRISFKGYDAVRTTLLANAKVQAGSIERALKRSGDKVTEEQAGLVKSAILATEFAIVLESSHLRRETAQRPYIFGLGVASDYANMKTRMRDFMGAFIVGGAPVPVECTANMAAAVEIRLERARNHTMPSRSDLALCREFMGHIRSELGDGFVPVNIANTELVLEKQNRATQQAILRDVKFFSGLDDDSKGMRASVKPKEVTKKPRIITVPDSADMKLQTAKIGYAIAALFKCFHWYASSMSPGEIADAVVRKAARAPYKVTRNGAAITTENVDELDMDHEVDVSNMDGHHSALTAYLMLLFCKMVIDPIDHGAFMAGFNHSVGVRVAARGIPAYQLGWALGSGLWWTTMKNGLTGAFNEYRIRRFSKELKKEAYLNIGLHAGDDATFFGGLTVKSIVNGAASLGLPVTVVPRERGGGRLGFLARFYDTTDGSSYPDIKRVFSKFTVSGLPDTYTDEEVAALKSFSVLYCDTDTPVITPVMTKILHAVAPHRLEKILRGMRMDRMPEIGAEYIAELAGNDYRGGRADVSWNAHKAISSRSRYKSADPSIVLSHYEEEMGVEYIGRLLKWAASEESWKLPPKGDPKPVVVPPGFPGSVVSIEGHQEPLESGPEKHDAPVELPPPGFGPPADLVVTTPPPSEDGQASVVSTALASTSTASTKKQMTKRTVRAPILGRDLNADIAASKVWSGSNKAKYKAKLSAREMKEIAKRGPFESARWQALNSDMRTAAIKAKKPPAWGWSTEDAASWTQLSMDDASRVYAYAKQATETN